MLSVCDLLQLLHLKKVVGILGSRAAILRIYSSKNVYHFHFFFQGFCPILSLVDATYLLRCYSYLPRITLHTYFLSIKNITDFALTSTNYSEYHKTHMKQRFFSLRVSHTCKYNLLLKF